MANFISGIGRVSADLYDFYKHINGQPLTNGDPSQHAASIITTSPGVGGASDVQTSIDNINTFIIAMTNIGRGFASIPDGYDSYTNPAPNYYFDVLVPPLNDFLIPLFSAISTNSDMPVGYDRIKDGGILYIPAGTYYITETVSIPPGIVLLGEGYATKIINATSLDLGTSPPSTIDLGGTPAPIFLIKADLYRSATQTNDWAVDLENPFMFSRSTKLINLTISDNFIEPTITGDYYYNIPQNTSGDTPLIMQEQGSSLEIHDIKMLGRVTNTAEVVDSATTYAIKLDTTFPSNTGTFLKITNSFIDGFSIPISFQTTSGIKDYLEVGNCKIRAHGYLDGDGSDPFLNCIIQMNDNNALISNNEFYGNHDLLTTICFLSNSIGSPPAVQNKSNILICSNTTSVGRAGGSHIEMTPISFDFSPVNYLNYTTYGNDQANFEVFVDSTSSQLSITKDLTNIRSSNINIISSGDTTIGDGTTDAINLISPNLISNLSDTNIIANTSITLNAPTIDIGDINTTNIININTKDTGGIKLDGSLFLRTREPLGNTTYYIDSDGYADYIILAHPSFGGELNIALPSPSLGRTIIIKDKLGDAGNYRLAVYPEIDITDSYDFINSSITEQLYAGGIIGWAQSFTGNGKPIVSCKLSLMKTGAPVGTATVVIYEEQHATSFGVDSIPNEGAEIEISAPFYVSQLNDIVPTTIEFVFSNNSILTNGTKYTAALLYSDAGSSASDSVDIELDNSAPSHSGNASYYDQGAGEWAESLNDLCFEIITSDILLDGLYIPTILSAPYGSYTFIADGENWGTL